MNKKAVNNKIPLIFLSLYLLVLVFFSESQALTNNGVVIPFIEFNVSYLFLALIGVFFIYTLLLGSVKVDAICAFLFARIVLCVLPLLTNEVMPSYIGNFVVACFPLFIYVIFRNCHIDISKATLFLMIFGVIIALQCILAYFTITSIGYASYNDPFYKNYFVIPAGATNDISAILVALLILGDQVIQKFKIRLLFDALLLIAIFLCKSRTGMILSAIYLLYVLFIKKRGKYKVIKTVLTLGVGVVGIFILPLLIDSDFGNSVTELLLGYASKGDGLDALFSGRFELFNNVFEFILQHPIIGNGLSYEKLSYLRTHNVFLQMAYENGLVGLTVFTIFLFVCIYTIFKNKNKNIYYHAFFVTTPFVIINAMVEETLLSNFMVVFSLLFIASMNGTKKEGVK